MRVSHGRGAVVTALYVWPCTLDVNCNSVPFCSFLFCQPRVFFTSSHSSSSFCKCLHGSWKAERQREREREGAGQTKTLSFQISHCSLLAKTNCYCEKCEVQSKLKMKSPLCAAHVERAALMYVLILNYSLAFHQGCTMIQLLFYALDVVCDFLSGTQTWSCLSPPIISYLFLLEKNLTSSCTHQWSTCLYRGRFCRLPLHPARKLSSGPQRKKKPPTAAASRLYEQL